MTAQEIEVIEAEINGAGPGQDQDQGVPTETGETLVIEGTDIERDTGDVEYSFLRDVLGF